MGEGATVTLRYSLMGLSNTPRNKRWQERNDDIPSLVSTAAAKFRQPEQDATGDVDPVDLWGNFEPPTLPRGLLPEKIENYARVQAEVMGVDPGGMAMAALAVCADAIPDGIKLMMKGWSGGLKDAGR